MAKTILVADDSPTIRKIVELTFADTEIGVLTVGDGTAALEAIERLQPDAVLADVVMPRPTGYGVCRRVKRSGRPIPVMLLVGTFEPFDPTRAEACAADGHLVKPFESDVLRAKVEALLRAEPRQLPEDGEDEEWEDEAPPAPVAAETTAARPRPAPTPAASPGMAIPAAPSPALVEAVARAIIEKLPDELLREVAREVVRELAPSIIRERIRELERE